MPPFIFLGLIVLILFWMLCTWSDEREQADVPITPVVMEKHEDAGHSGERSLYPQKDGTFNKELPYSRLKRPSRIRAEKLESSQVQAQNLRFGASSQEDHPHDHPEYPHETPEALRPRRVVLARPPEEEEDDAVVKKSVTVQTDVDPEPVLNKAPQTSGGTQKDVETEESTSQTAISPLRASRGVQADVEREDVGVEALPSVTSRGSQAGVGTQDAEAEEPVPKVASRSSSAQELADDRFESCPLKTKYLSFVPVVMEAQRDEGDWDERSLFPQKDGTLKRGSSYPSESEEESESFESYPLKPKYLSSPSQSEEESEQPSSESSGTLRQRYSIIQPFMRDEE